MKTFFENCFNPRIIINDLYDILSNSWTRAEEDQIKNAEKRLNDEIITINLIIVVVFVVFLK